MNNPIINIQTRQPFKARLEQPASSNKMILKRRLMEIQADAQTDYSYTGNSQITFSINSVSDLVDFSNSYIRLKLTTTLKNNGGAQSTRYLAMGGIHSLFSNIEVRTASGVLLQRIDRYNKLYALMSQQLHSREHIETVLNKAGDSILPSDNARDDDASIAIAYTVAGSSYTSSTKTLLLAAPTAPGADLRDFLITGDLIIVGFNTGTRVGRVASVSAAGTIVFTEDLTGADVISPNVLSVSYAKAGPARNIREMRNLVAVTDAVTLCMKPLLPVLDTGSYFPLMLLRGGLKVVLTLDDPAYVLAFEDGPNTVSDVSYTIRNPVFVVDMVQPSEILAQQYIDAFKTDGLKFVFPAFKWNLDSGNDGSAGSYNTSIQSNVRSARYILAKINDARAETRIGAATEDPGVSTYTCDSIAQGRRAGLEEFRFVSNGESFPLNGLPLRTNDICALEVAQEVERALGLHDSGSNGKRISPNEWNNIANYIRPFDRTYAAESDRFHFGARLCKDDDNFTGLDLTLSALQCEYTFNATNDLYNLVGTVNVSTQRRYIHSWICHDALLLISASGSIVFS